MLLKFSQGCATAHAVSDKKVEIAKQSAKKIFTLIEKDIKPSDILTQEAFEDTVEYAIDLLNSL